MQSQQDESIDNSVAQEFKQRTSDECQRILDQAAGLWRDRDDLPDWNKLRRSLDRARIEEQLKHGDR